MYAGFSLLRLRELTMGCEIPLRGGVEGPGVQKRASSITLMHSLQAILTWTSPLKSCRKAQADLMMQMLRNFGSGALDFATSGAPKCWTAARTSHDLQGPTPCRMRDV